MRNSCRKLSIKRPVNVLWNDFLKTVSSFCFCFYICVVFLKPVCELDLVLEKWEASDKEETKEEEQTVTPPAAEPSESKVKSGNKHKTTGSHGS